MLIATTGYLLNVTRDSRLTLISRSNNYPMFIVSMTLVLSAIYIVVSKLKFELPTHMAAGVLIALGLAEILISPNGFSPNGPMGLHWYYQAEALFKGQIALGDYSELGILSDVLVRNGEVQLPYPVGSVTLVMLFGKFIRLGSILLTVFASYLYTYLGRMLNASRDFETDIFVLVGIVLFFLSSVSSTFYAPGYIGAIVFLPITFIYVTEYLSSGHTRELVAAGAALLLATLFRSELVLIYPTLCFAVWWRGRVLHSKTFVKNSKVALAALFAMGAISSAFIMLQAYLRFGSPFTSGMSFHHNAKLNPEAFFSASNFLPQFKEYFFGFPVLDCYQHWSCLYYNRRGPEQGGWLTVRNPLLVVALLRQLLLDKGDAQKIRLPDAAVLPLLAASTLIVFYLFYLGNSCRYHALFTPLLIVGLSAYFPRNRSIRISLIAVTVALNLLVYDQFFECYPEQS